MVDLVTGVAGESFTVRKTPIQGLALSPDGKTFVSGGLDSPAINVWDIATKTLRTSLHGHNLVVLNLAYSADGQRMMSSSIGSEAIKVWDTKGWQQVYRLVGHSGLSLSLPGMLSDGNTIAANELDLRSGKGRIRVWQAASWEEINATEAAQKPEHITQ